VDNGEVIALDIPYATYAVNQNFYREAFTKAFASVLGYQVFSIYVTNFQTSSAGTTLIYFDTILYGTDYDTVAANAAVRSLFSGADVGSPAIPALVNAFIANGLPVGGAYYNDHLASTPSAYVDPGAVPIVADKVGTWQHMDNGEVIALNITYATYATNQQYYKEAFAAGLAAALGGGPESIWVNDFQPSAVNTVRLFFDIALPDTSSTAISNSFAEFKGLFTDCPLEGHVGCPAGPELVGNLTLFGLPLTSAFYNQQYPL
jgi:hypothetical protein